MFRFLPFAVCWLLLFLFLSSGWADLSSQRSQLKKISASIDRAETALQNKKRSELNINRELALIKKTLEQINRRIAELKTALGKLRKETGLQRELLDKSRRESRKIASQLKKRLVALYKEGETGPLKILFSADSPTEMVQQYHYFKKILQHDKELLEKYRKATQVQQQNLVKLEDLRQQKIVLLEKEQQQQHVASKGRRLQARLLRQAQNDKKKLAGELKQLKENAARLKALISRLEQESVASTAPMTGSFAVRGQLDWPVSGHVVIGFGQQKDVKLGTYYESNGIEIATPSGSPVRAVAAGKVVFADYFKGYGNLFILSHPGGYHTLYAQIDRMVKKVGEQVVAGDLLGQSGLAGRDSIYFEIRSKGSPVNPLSWLKKR